MNTLCIVKDQVIGKLSGEEFFIMDGIKMIIDELFLYGPVVSLNIGIDLGTAGIGEKMKYPFFFELEVELTEVLAPVVGLPCLDLSRVQRIESPVEIPHVSAAQSLVSEGKSKSRFDVHGTVEIILYPVCYPLYRIADNVSKINGLR